MANSVDEEIARANMDEGMGRQNIPQLPPQQMQDSVSPPSNNLQQAHDMTASLKRR